MGWYEDKQRIEEEQKCEARFFNPHENQRVSGYYQGQTKIENHDFAMLRGRDEKEKEVIYLVPDKDNQFKEFQQGDKLEVSQGQAKSRSQSMSLKPSPNLLAQMKQWEAMAFKDDKLLNKEKPVEREVEKKEGQEKDKEGQEKGKSQETEKEAKDKEQERKPYQRETGDKEQDKDKPYQRETKATEKDIEWAQEHHQDQKDRLDKQGQEQEKSESKEDKPYQRQESREGSERGTYER